MPVTPLITHNPVASLPVAALPVAALSTRPIYGRIAFGLSVDTYTYPNGFRVVYEPSISKTPNTYIRTFCHVGSINEPDGLRGVSHFIEHMCFKGSKSYPSWYKVNAPFSHTGAYFNATTTKQYTCYSVDCLNTNVAELLTILGDILLHSTFDKDDYKSELNVVAEEMKMRMQEMDTVEEAAAFKGSAYGKWVDHYTYHFPKCLPYKAVLDYYHQYYVPQNMVISIVSSIPYKTIMRHLSATAFPKPPKNPHPPLLNPTIGTLEYNGVSIIKLKRSAAVMTRIEVGIRVCDQFNDRESC